MAPTPDLPVPGEDGTAHPFPQDPHDVRHLALKAGLLVVWAMASFGVCFFARDLLFSFGDWPVGLWMASQGAVFVFIGIVVVYAWAMGRFEREDALRASATPAGGSAPGGGAEAGRG